MSETKKKPARTGVNIHRSVGLAKIPSGLREGSRTEYRATVTAHQFRHLFATNLFYAGIPDMVAQQLLGHADIMTTRRIYQHLRGDESQKYTAMLDAYVSGKT